MSKPDVEDIKKGLADINAFVKERFDPAAKEVGLLKDETGCLRGEVAELQRRERAIRRQSLMSAAEEGPAPSISDGPYTGMDVLDLGILRRFAYSQRRESFGPAWVQRTLEAKRSVVEAASAADIQTRHADSARKLPLTQRLKAPIAGPHQIWKSTRRSASPLMAHRLAWPR